jgi:hypothetical protein
MWASFGSRGKRTVKEVCMVIVFGSASATADTAYFINVTEPSVFRADANCPPIAPLPK